jgi:hypothetical protein
LGGPALYVNWVSSSLRNHDIDLEKSQGMRVAAVFVSTGLEEELDSAVNRIIDTGSGYYANGTR